MNIIAPTVAPITQTRLALLLRLDLAGGTLTGRRLTTYERRLASMMQAEGLVRWEQGDAPRRCLGRWLLHITAHGSHTLATAP